MDRQAPWRQGRIRWRAGPGLVSRPYRGHLRRLAQERPIARRLLVRPRGHLAGVGVGVRLLLGLRQLLRGGEQAQFGPTEAEGLGLRGLGPSAQTRARSAATSQRPAPRASGNAGSW